MSQKCTKLGHTKDPDVSINYQQLNTTNRSIKIINNPENEENKNIEVPESLFNDYILINLISNQFK